MNKSHLSWKAAGFGAIAGMRASSTPALLSNHFCRHPGALQHTKWKWFCQGGTAQFCTLMAVGEVLADKIPNIPNRTAPPGLIGRALSGALAGAVLNKATGGKTPAAPWIGAGVAVAATFASFYARKALAKRISDRKAAIVEDLIVYGAGALLSRSISR